MMEACASRELGVSFRRISDPLPFVDGMTTAHIRILRAVDHFARKGRELVSWVDYDRLMDFAGVCRSRFYALLADVERWGFLRRVSPRALPGLSVPRWVRRVLYLCDPRSPATPAPARGMHVAQMAATVAPVTSSPSPSAVGPTPVPDRPASQVVTAQDAPGDAAGGVPVFPPLDLPDSSWRVLALPAPCRMLALPAPLMTLGMAPSAGVPEAPSAPSRESTIPDVESPRIADSESPLSRTFAAPPLCTPLEEPRSKRRSADEFTREDARGNPDVRCSSFSSFIVQEETSPLGDQAIPSGDEKGEGVTLDEHKQVQAAWEIWPGATEEDVDAMLALARERHGADRVWEGLEACKRKAAIAQITVAYFWGVLRTMERERGVSRRVKSAMGDRGVCVPAPRAEASPPVGRDERIAQLRSEIDECGSMVEEYRGRPMYGAPLRMAERLLGELQRELAGLVDVARGCERGEVTT